MEQWRLQLKIHPNSNFLGIYWTLLKFMWIGIVLNSTIVFVYVPFYPEIGVIAEGDFLMKVRVICQLLQSPFSDHMSLYMVVKRQLLSQWILYGCRRKWRSKIRVVCGLWNAKFLLTTWNRLHRILLHTLTDSGDVAVLVFRRRSSVD